MTNATAIGALTVLNVSQNYRVVGGADAYFFQLGDLLTARGHRVVPFAAGDARNVTTAWDHHFPIGANFEKPGPRDILRFVFSFPARRAIRELLPLAAPDIAHLHNYYGKLTASILQPLRDASVPIVQTLHDYKVVCPVYSLYSGGEICERCAGKNFYRALLRGCNRGSPARTALSVVESYVSRWLGNIRLIDHFIAVSDFMREKLVSLGVPAHKLSTVHNFVDATRFRPATEPGRYFLYYGRLEQSKGIFTLLEAAARTQLPVIIAGTGTAQRQVEQKVSRLRLGQVSLVGFQQGDALWNLVRGSLCTIVPTHMYETFGLSIVESFACARPVIASRIGGMPEVVTDGIDGILCPPGDAEALASYMSGMANDSARAFAMGQAGRRKVEQRFTPQDHYEKLMAVYDKVAPATSRRACRT